MNAHEPEPRPDYPKPGVSQEDLNNWIDAEIGRRMRESIRTAKTSITYNDPERPGVEVVIEHWVAKFLVANFRQLFIEHPEAINAVEMVLGHPGDQYLLTITRPGGKTPTEQVYRLKGILRDVATILDDDPSVTVPHSCAARVRQIARDASS